MKNPLAGQPAPASGLVNVARLVTAYFAISPDVTAAAQRVSFGTSGHRGSALRGSFNEAHILAIAQAICLHRDAAGVTGPLFLGMDTHALSEPAFATALEVFAANGVDTVIDAGGRYTPTPVVSHAILGWNRGRTTGWADGVVISPSHNPPDEGGIKYNPPSGGPADVDITKWIEGTANRIIEDDLRVVRRIPLASARASASVHLRDYVAPYVEDLASVVDLAAIRAAGVRIGVDPLGGASVDFWPAVIDRYGLDGTVVNGSVDPTFRFMTLDWDGVIRMDCSSPDAMAPLIALKDRFDIAFGNDTDADRHGIVCPSAGLMKPNAFLVAAVAYLFANRPDWPAGLSVGKTIVSSAMMDRLVAALGRPLFETPVGFKWFTQGLLDGTMGFGGEESAGASFLRRDGSVWTTDKDGLILSLLAAELCARTAMDPGQYYAHVTRDLGRSYYERIDAPASAAQKARLGRLDPQDIRADHLAGEPVLAKLSHAPGNGQPLGGVKVATRNGWFAARPSGTEAVYKIYAESFESEDHLRRIQSEAQGAVDDALAAGPS